MNLDEIIGMYCSYQMLAFISYIFYIRTINNNIICIYLCWPRSG